MKKLSFIFLLAAVATIFASRASAQVIVIANPSVKANDITKAELKDVFTGAATSLKDGSQVTPILLKEGTVHEIFLSAYIGKGDAAFRVSWRNLVFSGQVIMPKSVETDDDMVQYVAHHPGAVGYINKSTSHDGVKILNVK